MRSRAGRLRVRPGVGPSLCGRLARHEGPAGAPAPDAEEGVPSPPPPRDPRPGAASTPPAGPRGLARGLGAEGPCGQGPGRVPRAMPGRPARSGGP